MMYLKVPDPLSLRAPVSRLWLPVIALLPLLLGGCASLSQGSSVGASGPGSLSSSEPVDDPEAALIYELLVGEIAGHMGELQVSMEHYLRAAGRSNDPQIAERAMRIALFAEDMQAAQPAARRWVELDPDNLEARQVLGALLVNDGNAEEAAFHLGQVLDRSPEGSGQNLGQLIAILLQTDQPEAALATLAHLMESHPDEVDLRVAYGRLLLQAGEFEQARAQFARILEDRPGDLDMLFTLGLIFIETGQYPQAREALEAVLASGGSRPDAHYYLGRIHEIDGDVESALHHYGRVTEGPDVEEALVRSARLRADRGDVAGARASLVQLRRTLDDPQMRVQAYVAEAGILRDAGQYSEGMKLLDAALRQHPRDMALLYTRALMAERLGLVDQVEADLRLMLASDPDNAAALNALGYTLADHTDRIEEAYGYISRAYDQQPEDAAITDSMGWVLYRMGRLEEAEEYLRRALEMMDDGEIAANLAMVLWTRNKQEEALEVLESALERHPGHPRLLRFRDQMRP